MAELNWGDDQWHKVNEAVTEAFNKASVAAAFLPMYGPLEGSAEIVRNDRLQKDDTSTPPIVRIDRDHNFVNRTLVNLTVPVELSSEQIADETLSNALLAFRRAANILALEQDRVVFAGYKRGFLTENSRFVVNGVEPQEGLADLLARTEFEPVGFVQKDDELGKLVVSAVVKAMTKLEDNSNPAPFACVLGNTFYEAVHDPSASLVLPADRVTPLLKGGPLLRSGRIDAGAGIVVSLAGNAIDIVVGTSPTVQFLQRQENAKFLFRVYLRFALRFRDKDEDLRKSPVEGFRITPDLPQQDLERERLEILRGL